MTKYNFFDKQTALTAAKIDIYKEYITHYLPKLLMSYGKCQIFDLFCGAGYNGQMKGSPLILIDQINYILTNETLQRKSNLTIEIVFNDESIENISNLKEYLDKILFDKKIIKIRIECLKYEDILPSILSASANDTPKFFFVDPFTYSIVKMVDLKRIMGLPRTEVLLFIPVFHSYRFATAKFEDEHKTRRFIEEFTIKGMFEYKDLDDFLISIKEKLVTEINLPKGLVLPYIRYIILDGGSSKNSLFLLTGHQKGMLLMNKIASKQTDDGNRVIVKHKGQQSLFDPIFVKNTSLFYNLFKKKLIEYIRNNEITLNIDLIDFVIRECFLPQDAKCIIKDLYTAKQIVVLSEDKKLIDSQAKWSISEDPTKKTYIKWISNEKD